MAALHWMSGHGERKTPLLKQPLARIGETRLHWQAKAWGVSIYGNRGGWPGQRLLSERGVIRVQGRLEWVEPSLYAMAGAAPEPGPVAGPGSAIEPPPGTEAEVADCEEGCRGYDQQQQDGAEPAQTGLGSVVAEDARFAHVGREGCPTGVVVHPLAGGVIGLEKTLGPVLLVQAHNSRVTAHDAFVQNATGKEAIMILLQRKQMALADFGDRGDVFQRNAAGQPLHAQVFSKVSHRRPENR